MRIPLFLFLLITIPAVAAEKSMRSCRILFLDGPSEAPQKLHLFDGTNSQEVELPRMNFSPVYEVPAAATSLALLPAAPPAPIEGKPTAIPNGAPHASLAENITDFYLILSSDPSNRIAPITMQVIPADIAQFNRGQMLWYNLTDSTVGGILGSRKLLIKPNSRLILDPPAKSREDYRVNIHFQPPGQQRAEPLCETLWTHDPRSRTVFFILKTDQSAIPRILGFADFRGETPTTQ
jgi:hypothetical protein